MSIYSLFSLKIMVKWFPCNYRSCKELEHYYNKLNNIQKGILKHGDEPVNSIINEKHGKSEAWGTFFGCEKEFSSITFADVSTVFVDPDNCNEFGSSPSREILRFTAVVPKFTTCKSQLIQIDDSANESINGCSPFPFSTIFSISFVFIRFWENK